MRTNRVMLTGMLVAMLVSSTLAAPALSNDEGFTLAYAIPEDVFLYVAEKHNPERAFLHDYWGEVWTELIQSGVGDDLLELINSLLGMENEQMVSEFDRLRNQAMQLIDGVDWVQLGAKESVFAELYVPPKQFIQDGQNIMMAEMVSLLRGTREGAAHNFEGLAAILEVLADEVNHAAGRSVILVKRMTQNGIQIASLQVPMVDSMSISVALHDDIIVIGVRDHLFKEVLAMMDGSSKKKSLAQNPKFQAVFAKLSPAEDSMSFFNMKALMDPMRTMFEMIIKTVAEPNDYYVNSGMTNEVNKINTKAMAAYQQGNIEQALALVNEAYSMGPNNSIVLYNLACFNTLAGNKDEGLDWLQKAVEGGFYAPKKIAQDSDLASLHGEPRFKAALARASELTIKSSARDIVENYDGDEEAIRLRMEVHQTYETKDYEQGLRLIKQAYAIAPDDTKVVYTLGCLHTLLGHEEEGFKFLEEAVEGGFYCPNHMSKDPDLDSIRNHERYMALIARAQELAAIKAVEKRKENLALAEALLDRIANAASILDYSATTTAMDGCSATSESIVTLVPDAKQRPIYPVFCNGHQMTDFDRYLPQETLSFAISGGINLSALYKFIEDTIGCVGQEGKDALAKWQALQKQVGIDIRRDLIDWIGNDSIEVTLEDGQGSIMMIKVKDEETARKKISTAIDFCSTKLLEVIGKKPELAALAMLGLRTSPADHDQLEGFQNVYFSMSPTPFVWGVADGYLIFSSSADAIALCLATAKGEHPSIRQNERAMNEAIIPDGPFCSVSMTDQRGLGDEIAAGIGIATMVSGMMGSFIPEPKVRPIIAQISGMLGKLTPVVQKINFYKSESSCTTFDGQTWHVRAVTHYLSPNERAGNDEE